MYKFPGEMVYTGMEQYKVVDKMIDFLTAWANRHDGECEWAYRKQDCHCYRRWLEGRLEEAEKQRDEWDTAFGEARGEARHAIEPWQSIRKEHDELMKRDVAFCESVADGRLWSWLNLSDEQREKLKLLPSKGAGE